MSRHSRQVCVALVVAALALVANRFAHAQNAEREKALEFRRVYVPAERVADWPIKKVPYKTAAPEEFERWVREIDAAASDPAGAPVPARLAKAHYTATWDGARLLNGEAQLTLVHLANSPALLALDPCNLAIERARWNEVDEASEADTPAVGLDSSRRLAVLVDRGGTLVFDWHLSDRSDALTATDFELKLPRAAETTLELTLPSGWRVEASRGVVQPPVDDDASRAPIWRISLGGHTTTTLSFVAAEADAPNGHAIVRQESSYDISLRGIELSVSFELDVRDEPLRELALRLPSELRVVSARLGEERLSWTSESADSMSDTRLVLHFDAPVHGSGRVVRLLAVAPLVVDERWRLPVCQLEGVFWQEGTATLRIEEPLVAEDLHPARARQTSIGPLADPQRGDQLTLQLYEPDASVELTLRHAEAEAELDSVTTCEWSGTELLARLTTEVRLARGERFALAAQIGEGWNIKTVEATPAGMLTGWHIEPNRDGTGRLVLQLAEPITSSQPLLLDLTASRLRPSQDHPLAIGELELARFEQVRHRHTLIAFETTGVHRLEFDATAGAAVVDDNVRSAMAAGLFAGDRARTYYDLRTAGVDTSVGFVAQSPAYTATVAVDVTADDTHLWETTTLECVPTGSRVGRVLVQFSPPRTVAPTWRQSEEQRDWFTAERLDEAHLISAGFLAEDEVWEINLRQARSTPFKLEAVRSVDRGDEEPISLAILPEATTQSATVSIDASREHPPGISNRRLQPIPPPTSNQEHSARARAYFRYSAGDITSFGFEAPLLVTRRSDADLGPPLVILSSHVDSLYDAAGAAQHVATLRLAQRSAEHLVLRMPANASVEEVLLDGLPLARQVEGATLTVPLTSAAQGSRIEIHYRTPSEDWGSLATLANPLPLPPKEVPQFDAQWRFTLPSGMELLSPPSGLGDDAEPTPWGDRWFSLLAWAERDVVFRPWRRDDWLSLVGAHRQAPQAERTAALVLAALGAETPPSSDAHTDWGSLVSSAAKVAQQARWTLYVDGQALAELGIVPAAVPPVVAARQAVDRGARRLTATGLLLLAHHETLMLTTARAAAEHTDELMDTPPGGAAWRLLRDGTLSRKIQALAALDARQGIFPAANWTQQAPVTWQGARASIIAAPGVNQGTIYRLGDAELAQGERTIVRADRLRVAAWALFAILLTIGWQRRHLARGTWIVVALAAAAAALAVPQGLAVLFSSVLIASLALLVAGLLRPPVIVERTLAREQTSSRSLPAQTAQVLVVVVGLIGLTRAGHAAQPAVDDAGAYEVLIPVDAERRPTGARYQVPEGLYNGLQQLLARSTAGPQGVLIESAVYRGELTPDASQQSLTIKEITASLELRVFGVDRRIAIPFDRDRSGFVPASARLDGLECATEWLDDGTQLALEVPNAGAYRLELTLQPKVATVSGKRGISLAIPPVHTSRLELTLPAASPRLDVPTASGPVQVSQDGGLLTAELGPSELLEVNWRESAGGMRAGAQVEVEELLWLQVRPGAVIVEARLNYNAIEPGVTLLEWEIDPRLRVIPSADGAAHTQIRTAPEAPHKLQFELSATPQGAHTLAAKFLYTEASGVGSLSLPHITPLGAVVSKRWLAVSVDPSLDSQVRHEDDVSAFDAEKFLAAWGAAREVPPWRVFALSDAPREWRLVTRPKELETTVAELQTTSFDRHRALVDYQAEIKTGEGTRFQHVVNVPAEIELESVAVVEGTENRLLRWSRDASGRTTVMLTRAAAGPHTLRLSGSFDCATPSESVLPRISLADVRRTSAELRIFRKPTVLIDIEAIGPLANLPAPDDAPQDPALGQLVRTFRAERDEDYAGEVRVRTRENAPRVELTQFTVMRREKDAWQADLELELRVADGVVDELQFRIPASWAGPFTVNPAVATAEVTGDVRQRTLVVRFARPVDASQRLTIRGALAAADGAVARVPNIEPQHLAEVERFVTLPRRVDLEEVAWEMRGLVEAPRAGEVQESAFPRSDNLTYRVQAPQFEATLGTAEPLVGLPRVHLADIVVQLDSRGRARGTASFLLEPAGLLQCVLQLPEGQRLLAVHVDGTAAVLTARGPARWNVLLEHDRLPQVVEVAFADVEGSEHDARKPRSLSSPVLGELPVSQTLWTIESSREAPIAEKIGNTARLSSLRRELVRLASVADMIEIGAARASEGNVEDAQNWLHPWKQRIELARSSITRELAGADTSLAGAAQAELARIDEEVERVLERIPRAPQGVDENSRAMMTTRQAPADVWQVSHGVAPHSTTLSFVGAHSQLDLAAPSGGLDLARRYFTPALLAIAALLLASLVGGRALSDWAWRWPHFLGVAIGLVWWLWLWPSLLGLLLAVASALLATRVVRRPLALADRSSSHFRASS